MSDRIVNLSVSRRALMKGGALAAAAAASPCLPNLAFAEQIKKLEQEGWTKHPVACTMCGAFCGLVEMRKEGEPVSEKTVRIFPNPGHPQQGYCGRSAATMWVWNHPLRLKKPLKRVGEKGEGKFKEITWDEALDGIAGQLKTIVEKYGESSIASTSHTFSGFSKWITLPLGSPNNIGHASSCNAGGISGRHWVFGKGFDGAGKMEPDYANLRYLLLIGRSMGAAMGALHTLNIARANGARVVSIDPRMPDISYGDVDWVGIRPSTDAAFVMGLINRMIQDGTADFDFIQRFTNGAYLVRDNGRPLTQADVIEGGDKAKYVVANATGELSFRGLKKNEAGAVVFDEDPAFKAVLEGVAPVKLTDGTTIPVKTAYEVVKETAAPYTPEKVYEITGVEPGILLRIAKEFTNLKGVIDDGWYTSKNGTDVQLYQLICIANAMNGNIDIPGGLVVTAGAGFSVPSVSAGKGPNGEKWQMAKEKRIDKIVYPEASATFKVALQAAVTGKPYPIKGVFFVGTTMFHREANSQELAEQLKKLELCVVQFFRRNSWTMPTTYCRPPTSWKEKRWQASNGRLTDPFIFPIRVSHRPKAVRHVMMCGFCWRF